MGWLLIGLVVLAWDGWAVFRDDELLSTFAYRHRKWFVPGCIYLCVHFSHFPPQFSKIDPLHLIGRAAVRHYGKPEHQM